MADTSIRLSTDAKERLELHKRPGESYEDVIVRLTSRDKWAGFGILGDSDTDPREGMDRIREEMREGVASDIAEMAPDDLESDDDS